MGLIVAVSAAGVWALTSLQLPQLSPSQRGAIDRGERVLVTREREGSPWPAANVYVFVDASPEEAAAVFTDYELHATYIPSVKRSHISRIVDRATMEVDYVVHVPVLSDEKYTVRDRVSADGGGTFRVDWTLVKASSIKGVLGYARFSPYKNARTGRDGTLLEYFDFVTPGSALARLGFVKRRAIAQIEESAQAIGHHIEAERTRQRAMSGRITALRSALRSPSEH